MASENIETNQDKNIQSEGISPPYSVEEIIGDIAVNQAHKRPLQNAESMLKRGNLKSALEIYARVLQRVKDPDSTAKIKEIIDNISVEVQKDESLLQQKSIPNSRGATKVNFSKVLRDLTSVVSELSQTLQVQQEKTSSLPKADPSISGKQGTKNAEKAGMESNLDPNSSSSSDFNTPSQSPVPFFTDDTQQNAPFPPQNFPPQAPFPPPIQPSGYPQTSIPPQPPQDFNPPVAPPMGNQEEQVRGSTEPSPPPNFASPQQPPFPYSPPPFQNPISGNPQPSYPPFAPQNFAPTPGQEPPSGEIPRNDASTVPQVPPANQGNFPPPVYPPLGGGGYPPVSPYPQQSYPAPPPVFPSQNAGTEAQSEIASPPPETSNQPPIGAPPPRDYSPPEISYPKFPDPPPLGDGIPKGILNRLQILEDLYNRQDWQDLRNLPIRDRRTGKDRREEDIPVENDRRKGEERRDEDLLEKRDEFVSDYNESVDKGELPPQPDKDQNELTKKAPPVDAPTEPAPTEKPANQEVIEGVLPKINLPDPVTLSYDSFKDAPKRSMSIDKSIGEEPTEEGLKPADILFPTEKDAQVHEIFKINLPNPKDTTFRNRENEDDDDRFTDREINIIDAPPSEEKIEEAMDNRPEVSIPEIGAESREPPEAERIMHGILELKPPEVDDAPFLTLTFDFTKIPHSFRLSKNYSVMEYSYYKYKPMLMKAQEFARRKMLKNALNYYRVIRSQNIPSELRMMINRNITDITEFLEKFMMSKGG